MQMLRGKPNQSTGEGGGEEKPSSSKALMLGKIGGTMKQYKNP